MKVKPQYTPYGSERKPVKISIESLPASSGLTTTLLLFCVLYVEDDKEIEIGETTLLLHKKNEEKSSLK